MTPERRQEIQVGAAFLAAVFVLVAGVMWFKEFQIGGQYRHLVAEFGSTSGLQTGDAVEVAGVTAGSVEDIAYSGGVAQVTMKLERDIVLYPGTQVLIQTVGIMGQRMVSIVPGPETGQPIPDEQVLQGEYEIGLTGLMSEGGRTLTVLTDLAVRVDSLFATLERDDRVANTLENVDTITRETAELLSGTRPALTRSLASLDSLLYEMNAAFAGRGEGIGESLDRSRASLERLEQTLDHANTSLARVDTLLARMVAGDGTAGKMLGDEDLYDELRDTLRETRILLTDIREDPRKYFNFSVF
jgi:phospholipid/cholesterol/gamma-HCH transport system substrate-binding protein